MRISAIFSTFLGVPIFIITKIENSFKQNQNKFFTSKNDSFTKSRSQFSSKRYYVNIKFYFKKKLSILLIRKE